MFSAFLELMGLKERDFASAARGIAEELSAAGYTETVVRAAESVDRAANLEIIRLLLNGGEGVVRDPQKALLWAQWALRKKRKVQIAEYVEKIIPDEIAADRELKRQGFGPILEQANAGDFDALMRLWQHYLEIAESIRSKIRPLDVADNAKLVGAAADAIKRADGYFGRILHLPKTDINMDGFAEQLNLHSALKAELSERSKEVTRRAPATVKAADTPTSGKPAKAMEDIPPPKKSAPKSTAMKPSNQARSPSKNTSRQITWNSSFKHCATCDHWGGQRKVALGKWSVTFDEFGSGACYARPHDTRELKSTYKCIKFVKWRVLK